MKSLLRIAPLGLLMLVTGCTQPKPTATGTPTNTTTTASPVAANKTTPAEITITPISIEGFNKAIAAHKGKVVIVDFWATWCGPCRREFPHLVELHEKYGPNKLVCISVSEDKPNNKSGALKFLKEQKASFANYIWDDTSIPGKVRKEWGFSAIPAVRVYRPSGELEKQFALLDPDDPAPTYEKDIAPVVEKLLKQ